MGGALVGLDCTGPVTVAVLRCEDGRVVAVLGEDGSPLASGVFAAADGTVIAGRAGVDAAVSTQGRYVAIPALQLAVSSDGAVDGHAAVDLVAASLRLVRARASTLAGGAVTRTALVVPAVWGPQRRNALRSAAWRAGFTDIELVTDTTAMISRHPANDRDATLVLVYRVLGSWCEAAVLRAGGQGWTSLGAVEADLSDDQPVAEQMVATITRALHAADVPAHQISVVYGQATPAQLTGITAGLRGLGVQARVRANAETDTAHAALAIAYGQTLSAPAPVRVAPHAVQIGVGLVAAPVLLWLLLHSGTLQVPSGSLPDTYRAPLYLYTVWPTWAMVAILALHGSVGIVLLRADLRLPAAATAADEGELRRLLARGLRLAAAVGVGVGLFTAMQGAITYPMAPLWLLLLVALAPVLLAATALGVITLLIQHGRLAARDWQLWLRFPATATVLTAAGLIAIETYLYQTATDYSYLYYPQPPQRLARLGFIAVCLAVSAVLIRRITHQVIMSPVIITVALFIFDYTTVMITVGVLLAAVLAWWLTRISPASRSAPVLASRRSSTPPTVGDSTGDGRPGRITAPTIDHSRATGQPDI